MPSTPTREQRPRRIGSLRTTVVVLLCAVGTACLLPAPAQACDCFPPDVQKKTSQEALQRARVAALVRVLASEQGLATRAVVVEPFKGPDAGAQISIAPAIGNCVTTPAAPDSQLLVLQFEEALTQCELLPSSHYMLPFFRILPKLSTPAR